MTPEERLSARGIQLPPTRKPIGNYVSCVVAGNLAFLAGHGPNREGERQWRGKLGHDMTVDEGYAAAESAALNLLASLKAEIGDLARVRRIVKLLGMVNCTPDFGDQPRVINAASDLLVDLFGEAGRHARSAVGMASLPGGSPVEIEAIVEIE